MDKYILNEKGNPKKEKDLLKWAAWFQNAGEKRRVAETRVAKKNISTVFLGLDNSFGEGAPQLYETMIFPGGLLFDRYATKEQALEGHKRAVDELLGDVKK